jgi:hypothetical protein
VKAKRWVERTHDWDWGALLKPDGRCYAIDMHARELFGVFNTQIAALHHLNEWGEQQNMKVGERRTLMLAVYTGSFTGPTGPWLIDIHSLQNYPRRLTKYQRSRYDQDRSTPLSPASQAWMDEITGKLQPVPNGHRYHARQKGRK